MTHSIHTGLIPAAEVAARTPASLAPNGIRFATFGDLTLPAPTSPGPEIARLVQAVPTAIAAALAEPPSAAYPARTFYFVPLAIAESRAAQPADSAPATPPAVIAHRSTHDETLIAPAWTAELAELAICHRNVELPAEPGSRHPAEGIFLSARLFADRFSLAFEFFINVGHAFVDATGVPDAFTTLAWAQAVADTRGETSQDAWESRALALSGGDSCAQHTGKPCIDEKAKTEFLEAAFADAIAIYLLSLALDFDYSELREREYPLLAPQALAERLRLIHGLFPPNPTYEFAIRYRRRP